MAMKRWGSNTWSRLQLAWPRWAMAAAGSLWLAWVLSLLPLGTNDLAPWPSSSLDQLSQLWASAEPVKPRAKTPTASSTLPAQWKLKGLMRSGALSLAVVDTGSGEQMLKPGDSLGGQVVQNIEARQLVFVSGAKLAMESTPWPSAANRPAVPVSAAVAAKNPELVRVSQKEWLYWLKTFKPKTGKDIKGLLLHWNLDGTSLAAAGLRRGDRIDSFQGQSIADAQAFTAALSALKPEKTLSLGYQRQGQSYSVQLWLVP